MITDTPSVSQLSQVISQAVAPAFILGALAAFISVLIGRLNRVVDRSQALNAIGGDDPARVRLKADLPVIINLQGLSRDLQRRMIDFSSGLTYAVGGSMSRVADQVFLLTPSNVEVSQEEKERLQARGLFRA